jgi:hypothetical protein
MPKEHIPAHLRRLVVERARGCCEYCRSQARFAPEPFSIEHIVPRTAGGPAVESNLALSCQGCNNYKAVRTTARDSITDVAAALFNPRQQDWTEHFAWADDYTVIRGLTPVGRATVAALRLNREGLVNLRWVLYRIGEHPPKADDAVN